MKVTVIIFICSFILIACDDNNQENQADKEAATEIDENKDTNQSTNEPMQAVESGNDNFGEWITESIEILEGDLDDSRIKETEYDEGFIYYLKSQRISDLKSSMKVYEDDTIMEKDFENLHIAQAFLLHDQFVRTSDFGPNGEAKEATEHYKEWEPTSEDMHQAFDYLNKLMYDLDVAVNHNGEGETYGVTYTLNGDNVKEIEKFNGTSNEN